VVERYRQSPELTDELRFWMVNLNNGLVLMQGIQADARALSEDVERELSRYNSPRTQMIQARTTILLGTLLLAACIETPPRPAGEPIAVELGPVVRVLDMPTSHEFVQALIDDAGLAHVVVASPGAKTLRHIVVDPAGAVSLDEVIRSDVRPGSLDAAFDTSARLHVLAGPQHFVREPGGQWSEAPTPWAAAGLEAARPRFVHGAGRDYPLLYAFDVSGGIVGAPARWDLYGFGGYPTGIIWPWRTRGTRLAVVAEDGDRYDTWSVVGMDDNEDVADWVTIAEPGGRVHVVYDSQRTALTQMSLARHVQIEPAGTRDASRARKIAGRRLLPVQGDDVPMSPERPSIGQSAAVGFSPVTGELLLVREHLGGRVFSDGAWSPDVPYPLELAWEPRVASHARAGFDVVVTGTRADSPSGHVHPVLYLQFRAGRWSEPVEVGSAEVDSLFGTVWDAVQIASDGHERLLVTWPARDGIEARWLKLNVE